MNEKYMLKLHKKISKEYARYNIVQYLLKLHNSPNYVTWLEKTLVTMATIKSINRTDQVFLKKDDIPVFPQIIARLERYTSVDDSKRISIEMFNKINEFLITNDFNDMSQSYSISEPTDTTNPVYMLKCSEFKKNISKDRIIAMKNMLKDKYIPYWKELLLICVLRYECIVSYFTQWSAPLKYYEYIYSKYNVQFEAYASPFNSRLLMLSKNIKYGSLFYDTDKYFGSLGNAHDIDYTKLSDTYFNGNLIGVSLVPIINMDRATRNSFKLAYKNANIDNIFFIMITVKHDNKYYPKIIANGNLLYEKHLYEGQFYYEDIMGNTLTTNKYKYANILFIGSPKNFKKSFYSIKNAYSDDHVIKYKNNRYINKLKKEYNRYLVINEMRNMSSGLEWFNIFERFLMTMANIKKSNVLHDYVFSDVPIDHDVYIKMKNEMIEKKILGYDTIINVFRQKINDFLSMNFNDVSDLNYGEIDDEFFCESFKVSINKTRKHSLIKKLLNYNKSKYRTELILILCIRYACLSMGGNHWNLPHKLYYFINTSYNVQLECFASPLNSQLLIIDNNARFCSLFYDTDKYFGSYGNLFEANIVTICNEFNNFVSMSLFPPNVEDIIYKMLEIVDKWFKYVPKLRVFTGLLEWSDFPPMQLLQNHKYLKYSKKYNIGEYYFENSVSSDVPKILKPGKNSYVLYVLANFDLQNNEPPYDNMDKFILPY